MTATAKQVREGIADALRAIPGLQVSAYMLANPTLPYAYVRRGPVEYDQAFQGGVTVWDMRVEVWVAFNSDISAAQNLDEYLSTEGVRSVKQAIETDTTLGGTVSDLHVTEATGEEPATREQGGPIMHSEWTVQVWL